MKRLVIGILAHVDAGKTTLSEGLLFGAGEIRTPGRVDHQDAFLDTDTIERDRGITIFAKQALIHQPDAEFTLLDTPGHVDFSAEMERTLRVLDYAILVISGTDGVQSHTETLWKLLAHYDVPTFVFINKMDLPTSGKDALLKDLQERLDLGCVDFSEHTPQFLEAAAMTDEALLSEYLKTETLSDAAISAAIGARKLFPCFFGSALKMEGTKEFLLGLCRYTQAKKHPKDFGAQVFKIGEDEKGRRLTYMKITGGSLLVKTQLSGDGWTDKVNELRIYSGAKYESVQEAPAGSVCAAIGLSKAFAGEGLGIEKSAPQPMLEPVFSYSVKLSPNTDVHTALSILRRLAEEETQLGVLWNPHLQKIDVQLMGEVQMEVLKRILAQRFSLEVEFEQGSILYKETIQNTVEGVGHYEPLRHYAEVHLLLEPGAPGSGLVFASRCSEDLLDKNWQRLILTHLQEKTHRGVLCGAPLTDLKITLLSGRAHQKHTEGGDFRQATYRAVRQGLMQAESVLLEPWYSFLLEIPTESVGRAMTDLQQMGAEFAPPQTRESGSVLSGKAPIAAIRDYHAQVTAYTHGQGRLHCTFSGYAPCRNAEEVIAKIGYDCNADTENTADSVFCSHGSGFLVKWDQVFSHMHLPRALQQPVEEIKPLSPKTYQKRIADEAELLRIFERTYGSVREKPHKVLRTQKSETTHKAKPIPTGPEYLLIDGYNIIFAWDELKEIAKDSLEDARLLLIHRICNYQATQKNNVILVFDAYRVKGENREIETVHGISVVYTKEAETADAYIEKTTRELSRNYRVRVATSDHLEQIIIFGHGARRTPASEFLEEVEQVERQLRTFIEEHNQAAVGKITLPEGEDSHREDDHIY